MKGIPLELTPTEVPQDLASADNVRNKKLGSPASLSIVSKDSNAVGIETKSSLSQEQSQFSDEEAFKLKG
jgi:hypothetical protein